MNKKTRTVVTLVAVAALIVAACGGGDDKPKTRPTPPLPTATKQELAHLKQPSTGGSKDVIGTPAVAKVKPDAPGKPDKPAASNPAAAPKPASTKPGQM